MRDAQASLLTLTAALLWIFCSQAPASEPLPSTENTDRSATASKQKSDLSFIERMLFGGDRCDTIIPFIVSLSEGQPVEIVKIYKPQELRRSSGSITCSGDALLSDASRETVYFRRFRDEEGELLFQLSGEDDMD